MGSRGVCLALIAMAWLGACGQLHQPAQPVGGPPGAGGGSPFAALPAGEAAGAVKTASGTHVFTDADLYKSQGATMSGPALQLAQAGLSYAVLGVDATGLAPLSVTVEGTLSGLYLGAADYGRGCWQWLGGAHDAAFTENLPVSGWHSPGGSFFVALVCPDGASADLTAVSVEFTPDTDPPVWQGAPGVQSVTPGDLNLKLSWTEAVDALSPPVTYLIFCAPSAVGIDWGTPTKTVTGATSSWVMGLEDGTEYSVAVRARDAAGNSTTNVNYLNAVPTEGGAVLELPWEPGDKVEISWTDPVRDIDIMMFDRLQRAGRPSDPSELDGIIEFSVDSETSGLAYESAKLLPTAEPMQYEVDIYTPYADPSWQDEVVAVRVLDSSGALKYDLGSTKVQSGMGMTYAYLRYFNFAGLLVRDWQPGERIEVTWGVITDDVDLIVLAPDGSIGAPGYPDELLGEVEFSEWYGDSGVPVGWAKLLPGAAPGDYLISLEHDMAGPGTMPIQVKLYNADGTLKEDIGPFMAQPGPGFKDYALLHRE